MAPNKTGDRRRVGLSNFTGFWRNMLKVGEIAPDFTAKDENGSDVSLSGFRGKRVALFFYPKDDTPG